MWQATIELARWTWSLPDQREGKIQNSINFAISELKK